MFTKNQKRYILAGGCSFTCSELISPVVPKEESMFTRWPELLGEKLNLPVKNLAKSGRGNTWIYERLMSDLLNNHEQIEFVVVGWSEPSRYDLWDIEFTPMNDVFNKMSDEDKKFWAISDARMKNAAQHFHETFYQVFVWDNWDQQRPGMTPLDNIITRQIMKTFQHMLDLQKLCELLKKPLIMSSMLGRLCPFEIYKQMDTSTYRPEFLQKFDPKETLGWITNQQVILEINKKYCIGYPFIKKLGGFDFHYDIITEKSGLHMHPKDPHPNKQGHELIADMYYEHYTKTFPQNKI